MIRAMNVTTGFFDGLGEVNATVLALDCSECVVSVAPVQPSADAGQRVLVFPSEALLTEWRERVAALA